MRSVLLSLCLVSVSAIAYGAEPATTITIQTDRPGAQVSPTMWGIFFEDINLGADGGLYAELVKNRGFEFPNSLMGWSKVGANAGTATVLDVQPANTANPHYLRLESGAAGFGVANEGFRGIGVRAGETYLFSADVRNTTDKSSALNVALVSASGEILAKDSIRATGANWSHARATLKPSKTDAKARLEVILAGAGKVDLDMVSLFPRHTWKQRPGGLRADLVKMLAELKPGFMRFPGGCIVEGKKLDTRYQWKKTIGPVNDRQLLFNRWNDEFKHRPTPDYFQSFGLGFFEFFQLCEDIGAEPLPILNCGMACQFNSGELAPLNEVDSFVQDALDLIEFAAGPVDSRWGGQRAAMGHPKPFKMHLLGVGNEQWGPAYIERYAKFAQILKKAHPEVQLISSAGPGPDDDKFHFAWPKLREMNADIVDEHCYARPDWFFNNSGRYDRYDRKGPKVFMGEYAAQSVKTVSADNRNTWECALSEAAYMTGLERNADVVVMSSYAPLFAHIDGWQWTPNLIWFDNLRVYGTPSYYVQQMFGRNRGDTVLPVQTFSSAGGAVSQRFYASAVRDSKSGEVILKVVNGSAQSLPIQIQLAGASRIKSTAREISLQGGALATVNSLDHPREVAPKEEKVRGISANFSRSIAPNSFTILRIQAK